MNEFALLVWMVWLIAVPLLLLMVPASPGLWRRIGALTYLMIFVIWVPIAYSVYAGQSILLYAWIRFPITVNLIGMIFMATGMVLHAWTIKLLGIRASVGYEVIKPKMNGKLVTSGPFSVVRHPSYLAHSFMLLGAFLMTGFPSLGFLTLADFFLSYFVITRLEERELIHRFGQRYVDYQRRIPRFFPRFSKSALSVFYLW